jgi:hypothetical protein
VLVAAILRFLDHGQDSLKRMTIREPAEMIAAGCFAMKRALNVQPQGEKNSPIATLPLAGCLRRRQRTTRTANPEGLEPRALANNPLSI